MATAKTTRSIEGIAPEEVDRVLGPKVIGSPAVLAGDLALVPPG
jgi:hypothetical protein